MAKRPAKRPTRGRSIWLWIGLAATTLGVALVIYSGINYYFYNRSVRPAVAAPQSPAAVVAAKPTQIVIPGVLDEPLVAGTYADGKWSVSETTGTYLTQSAKPGEPGNIIIYGHNKKDIFGPLVNAKTGQTITLKLENGAERHYRIESTQEVSQDRTDVLAPSDQEKLTVYTCTGWLDQNRFIVTAVPTD